MVTYSVRENGPKCRLFQFSGLRRLRPRFNRSVIPKEVCREGVPAERLLYSPLEQPFSRPNG